MEYWRLDIPGTIHVSGRTERLYGKVFGLFEPLLDSDDPFEKFNSSQTLSHTNRVEENFGDVCSLIGYRFSDIGPSAIVGHDAFRLASMPPGYEGGIGDWRKTTYGHHGMMGADGVGPYLGEYDFGERMAIREMMASHDVRGEELVTPYDLRSAIDEAMSRGGAKRYGLEKSVFRVADLMDRLGESGVRRSILSRTCLEGGDDAAAEKYAAKVSVDAWNYLTRLPMVWQSPDLEARIDERLYEGLQRLDLGKDALDNVGDRLVIRRLGRTESGAGPVQKKEVESEIRIFEK